jgi:cephalosporin hydroxylase
MFPFWDLAIAPVLEAAGAERIVEIGALRGETTAFMLGKLGPAAELHVIDPVPVFDPSEHEREFPGRYLFHRALSHEVLPDLPPMDAALIDGDHNWYTVYHELKMLSDVARKEGRPLPLMILHDVGWPYGRRDLYYAPEQIPEEFRQPYTQGGMLPGESALLAQGGLNPTMYNADHEGGPRNGVMTAVDDFIDEYDRPLRLVFLPAYFGLAIVVEEERLAARPALAERLDWLEGRDGQAALVEMAERVRIEALIMQHGVFYSAEERIVAGAKRYLDLLKGAVLDEHYLEQELRIEYLMLSLDRNLNPRTENLRDPAREHTEELARLRTARRAGLPDGDERATQYFPYTAMGRVRLDHLQRCMETIRAEDVHGDVVECGTGRGGGAIFLRGCLAAYGIDEPQVWVADEFRARPPGVEVEDPRDRSATMTLGGGPGFPELLADLNNVRDGFDRFGLLDERVRFVQGALASAVPAAPIEKVSLLRLGESVTSDAAPVLDALYDKVTLGGFVVVERYGTPECRAAVDEFRARRGITEPIEQVDATAAAWRKTVPVGPATAPEESERTEVAGPPIAPARPWIPTDLTVVVVFYNMKREAARTLHSLSRAYQRDVDDLDYEVIVVDNGSAPDERLDKAFVQSFGKEFRFLDMGPDAAPSPIPALNRGIAMGRGKNFALMIDGAHVLTPRVLHFGMAGLATYEPAIVATQQWYVGPGQQADLVGEGYDQGFEDRLFDEINWPADGYRLFDIGHFIGERDWFDGMWESNCLFVARSALERFGCFDERFSMPGGGYANLDLFERLGATPDVTVATILGEGSFHQVHGGTTTNLSGDETRHHRLAEYVQHYADIRGKGFRGNAKPIHYVGSMPPEAARTKARRRVAPNLFAGAAPKEPGGIPQEAQPLPQDLQAEFTEAYWNTLKWRQTQWLGRRLPKVPGDLFAYQEVLDRVRPDWVIETGTGGGGRAWYLASICDLLGHGQVVTIDKDVVADRPEHPRITYITGVTHEWDTVKEVIDLVGEAPKAVVILGSRGTSAKMSAEFHEYERFVPRDSYLIMEDTIVGGHPVWGNFGVGPYEAVKGITETRGDFVSDQTLERYGLTFNPTGYLKRIR